MQLMNFGGWTEGRAGTRGAWCRRWGMAMLATGAALLGGTSSVMAQRGTWDPADAARQGLVGRGQVSPVQVVDPGMRIQSEEVRARAERPVATVAESASDPAPLPRTDAAAANLGARFERERSRLSVCPAEVAVRRIERAGRLTAGTVQLRFTVQPNGDVDGAEVVALSPTDPDVLDCVQRRVMQWRLDPRLNPVHVQDVHDLGGEPRGGQR